MSTFVAAESQGVSARTLQRWTADRLVTPARTRPSGRHEWHLGDLAEQVRRLRGTRTAS